MALPPEPINRGALNKTKERALTRRGIIWLGQVCNLKCHFCYFTDRLSDTTHPEHGFMSLEKAKAICKTLVDFYGNNTIDIQGGEPTIWKPVYELVSYCKEIGLIPTVITNGQALADVGRVIRFKKAGIGDFLVSVQGLGPVYDHIVGRPGAHVRQMKALRNLQEVGVPFRINCVLTKDVLPQLHQIAELAITVGANVVNFITFNPFDDQRKKGKRTSENVATYKELGLHLNGVLDVLADNGVEANVRNLPLCVVNERHRPTVYNHQQIPFDLHENDFASWSWTGMQPQRMAGCNLTPPVKFGPKVWLGPSRTPFRWLGERPIVGPLLLGAKRKIDQFTGQHGSILRGKLTTEEMYRREARLRAHDQVGFRHVSACNACDLKLICDGFHADYDPFINEDAAQPVSVGFTVDDPKFYISQQLKVVYPADSCNIS